jgi:hypothetical protein
MAVAQAKTQLRVVVPIEEDHSKNFKFAIILITVAFCLILYSRFVVNFQSLTEEWLNLGSGDVDT